MRRLYICLIPMWGHHSAILTARLHSPLLEGELMFTVLKCQVRKVNAGFSRDQTPSLSSFPRFLKLKTHESTKSTPWQETSRGLCFTFWSYLLLTPLKQFFSSVQSLSHVRLFVTPWTAACQASLSITNSWSLLSPMSIESVMPFNHLIFCHSLSCLQCFPASGAFQMNQCFTQVA